MPVLAVAGGTGQLGRTIVEAILVDGKYSVIIFARRKPLKSNPDVQEQLGVPAIALDYSNVDEITSALETHNVHTVISTIVNFNGSEPELNLIKAAERSVYTKRFVPSFWALEYPDSFREEFFVAEKKFDGLTALESTSLDYTAFVIPYFADYFFTPHVKSHLYQAALYIDTANNAAAIPGSGDIVNQFIYSVDVARYVVAALSLPKWEKRSYIVGDSITWNDFLSLIEESKGLKFSVVYDSYEKLAAGEISELPGHLEIYKHTPREQLQRILSGYGRLFAEGAFDLHPAHSLNDTFPSINPKTLRELAKEAWGP